jgi:hypothetical protein
MEIPLKTNFSGWYLCHGIILTKDTLVKRNWYGSSRSVFCHQYKTIKHLLFQCRFARYIWSIIQVASSLYPPSSVSSIYSESDCMVLISGLEHLLGWKRLQLSGRFGCVEMTNFWIIIIISFRLSTDVPVFSVYGHLFSGWRIATYLRRSVHDWRTRRGILFPYMGGCIIYGLELHLPLEAIYTYSLRCIFPFLFRLRLIGGYVHLSYAEAGCNRLFK